MIVSFVCICFFVHKTPSDLVRLLEDTGAKTEIIPLCFPAFRSDLDEWLLQVSWVDAIYHSGGTTDCQQTKKAVVCASVCGR